MTLSFLHSHSLSFFLWLVIKHSKGYVQRRSCCWAGTQLGWMEHPCSRTQPHDLGSLVAHGPPRPDPSSPGLLRGWQSEEWCGREKSRRSETHCLSLWSPRRMLSGAPAHAPNSARHSSRSCDEAAAFSFPLCVCSSELSQPLSVLRAARVLYRAC